MGQDAREEINVEPKGTGSKNYGWKLTEGKQCRDQFNAADYPQSCAGTSLADVTEPVHDYPHGSCNNCIIGGYVYRGSTIPSLQGYYLFGDNGSNRVWAMAWGGPTTGRCAAPLDLSAQLSLNGNITSFGEDANGEVYITTSAGNLYRIDAK